MDRTTSGLVKMTLLLCLVSGAVHPVGAEDASTEQPAQQLIDVPGDHKALKLSLVVPGKDASGQAMTKETIPASFDFVPDGGKPGLNEPVSNADGSLVAVTNYPATKTAYTRLFIRYPNGDLLAMNSFQDRIAKLVGAEWPEAADHLTVTSISGRGIHLKIVRYQSGAEGIQPIEHEIDATVSVDGAVSLSSAGPTEDDAPADRSPSKSIPKNRK